MKAIFIAYDQAHHESIITLLDKSNCRGFTGFGNVQGRGTTDGEAHYGSHAWPSLASAMMVFADDRKVDPLLQRLHELDLSKPMLGLRAWVWDVEKTI